MPSTLASFPLGQPVYFVPFPQFKSHPNPNQYRLYLDLGGGPAYTMSDKVTCVLWYVRPSVNLHCGSSNWNSCSGWARFSDELESVHLRNGVLVDDCLLPK